MLKPLIAATAVLAIAGSTVVYAQQGFGGHRGFGNDGPRAEHRHRPSAEDIAAYTDARIAALKAGLELTSDQAKNWPAFEQALRDMATLRAQRMQARQAAAGQPQQTPTTPATPFDRMSRRAETMTKFSATLKKVADAGAPLYMSLNDAQKGRFAMLARKLRPHHRHDGGQNGGWREGHRGQGEGHGHGGWQGRRFGQNGQGQDGRGEQGFHGHNGGHGMMNRSSDGNSNDL